MDNDINFKYTIRCVDPDEIAKKEKEIDEWFNNLNQGMKNIILAILWEGLDYSEKEELYLP